MTSRRSLAAALAAACLAAAFISTPTASFADGGITPPPPAGAHDEIGGITQATNTIIVTFDKDQKDPAAAAEKVVEQAVGDSRAVTQVTPITKDTVSVTIDDTMTPAESTKVGQQVEHIPGVDTAEPATTFTSESMNDPYYFYLWNVSTSTNSAYGTHAEDAWPATVGTGAVIGVVDTGITAHTDLTASTYATVGGNVVAGYDFISTPAASGDGNGRDTDATDTGDNCNGGESTWHGTHVTGIAVAIRNNGVGVVGVAPGAKVQPLRAIGKCGGAEGDIISAIRWGAGLPIVGIPTNNPTPASVLNLSIGGPGRCSSAMQSAIDAAVGKGVTVVVAAGNDAAPVSSFTPGGCKNIIRVAASTHEGTLTNYSNYGTTAVPITISAPGGSGHSGSVMNDWIVSTWNNGKTVRGIQSYMGMAGTSMAAPHVSATVALLKSLDKSLTPSQIASLLTMTATKMAAPCTTVRCGAGVVNAAAAVRYGAGRLLARVGTPTISGTVSQGSKLTAQLAGVPSMATVTYQWLRSGAPITGATAPAYMLTATDVTTPISVRVTTAIGTTAVDRVSATVTPAAPTVAPPAPGKFKAIKAPSTSGTFKVGRTVTASRGTQSPTPSTVTYRWLRNGTSISGATRSSYKLTKSDRGRQISVRATVSRSSFTTVSLTSSARKVS